MRGSSYRVICNGQNWLKEPLDSLLRLQLLLSLLKACSERLTDNRQAGASLVILYEIFFQIF